ncbi:hypothetical protein ATCV1_z188R [Acanthocystis turfacea chlorella virus 1]|uniref:Uncharacterized protein z188R n=1 Tax=Chlorovirus heliozoae TaxID=322019 RepID=A7K8E8_9PHYC|nr:hypothetical protein ATCV1_z188R [Acanthocystis turfacea chlorella virus 1]ABT16322.1 hypothetical protein ATCV1_z188R [Acanthocystis turfacea chlorella virus 1]
MARPAHVSELVHLLVVDVCLQRRYANNNRLIILELLDFHEDLLFLCGASELVFSAGVANHHAFEPLV